MSGAELDLPLEDIRGIALSLLEKALRDFELALHGGNIPPKRLSILTLVGETERINDLHKIAEQVITSFPAEAEKLSRLEPFLTTLQKAGAGQVDLPWLLDLVKFTTHLTGVETADAPRDGVNVGENKEGKVKVRTSNEASPEVSQALNHDLHASQFVAAMMDVCRQRNRVTSIDTEIALQKAYRLLDQGTRLPRLVKPLYKDRHREHQTYLSFADPGDGHLKTTVRHAELLVGTIVHIEWIDRDNVDDKSVVEAYRLPALRSAARVRLHVGDATPCTVFIGRPVFEGVLPGHAMDGAHFNKVLLKTAHTIASTCSSMFAIGVVDCKVAMDGLSTSQAIRFMKAVAGNVIRDPGVQMLSGAFNINTPLRDDRPTAPQSLIDNSFTIAEVAIDLVKNGNFDKVAWDGASNRQPSFPIVSQLTLPKLLQLVRAAHAKGLETYISAGMEPRHMRWAVYTGVGGVGIGTSLHHVGKGNLIGEVDGGRVLETLQTRDRAALNSYGRAAAALAELDWRAAERSISKSLNEIREQLAERLEERLPEFEGRLHEEIALERAIKEADKDEDKEKYVNRLKAKLDQWFKFEEQDAEINALLDRKASIEEEERQAAPVKEKTRESFGQATAHPLITRAFRVVNLHRSKLQVSGERLSDDNLDTLQTAAEAGDVGRLSDIFSKIG